MLKFNDKGLIPVIVQDADNGEVLMLAMPIRKRCDGRWTAVRYGSTAEADRNCGTKELPREAF